MIRKFYKKLIKIRNPHPFLKYNENDTFLVSYPRSGSTWLRFLIAYLIKPEIEWSHNNINNIVPDIYQVGEELNNYPSPRIIKSHETYFQYPRVIYLYRDGRDVLVSYYYHEVTTRCYKKSFNEFLDDALKGKIPFGAWHYHIESWLFQGHNIPFFPVRYENLYYNTEKILYDVARFIDLDIDKTIIENAIEHSTFDHLRRSVEKYSPHYKKGYRMGIKGGPGKWNEVFSKKQYEQFMKISGETLKLLKYE